jgi:CDP-L-myo-inositol myo-inositolphosphotransferase
VPLPAEQFALVAADTAELRRAEWRLLVSLRKPIDGLASRYINRHISLRMSRALMRTRVRPDHVTIFTMALGLGAGVSCALGGWAWAMLGVVLLELGSIIDGVDGELARLRYQMSTRGEWLDTLSDDLANVSFIIGATVNLARAGVAWAVPTGAVALGSFVVTQAVQYIRLRRMGRGDLLVLSWDSLSGTGVLAGVLRNVGLLAKRDFFVTAFVVLVAVGRLDVVLGFLAVGAVAVLIALIAPMLGGSAGEARTRSV